MGVYDEDESLLDDFLDDDYEEGRPVFDEAFLDEDLLEDEYDESISDEYDEEHLNEEGFHYDEDSEDDLFNSAGIDMDEYE